MAEAAGVRRVAVIGAGTIGASWAAYFLSRGLDVVASDPAPDAENSIRQSIAAAWPVLERLGVAADASPERCVTGHPFNPPHLIPLVEVVGGKRTSQRTIDRVMEFYAAIGKRPIHIRKEIPGHLANRLQAALWREAVHLVAEGVASVADVDAAIAYGPGLRWAIMGPHLTFHLAGGSGGMKHFMHHLAAPLQAWWEDLGDPVLTPDVQASIIEGVAAETGNRSIETLAQARDALLIELLALRQRLPAPEAS